MAEFRLYRNLHPLRDITTGFSAGIPSAILLISAFLVSGGFEVHSNWSASVIPRFLLTAAVVAVLEEFLFRGIILGYFRQFLGNWFAVFFSAVIFAALHFLNLPSPVGSEGPPQWWSGLASLQAIESTLPPWPLLAWSFGTLLLAGIILGYMTVRTGSLWASITLHGCWIFAQQLFNSMTSYRPLPADAFLPFVGPAQCHGAVPIGLDALFSILLAGGIAHIWLKSRPKPRPFAYSILASYTLNPW